MSFQCWRVGLNGQASHVLVPEAAISDERDIALSLLHEKTLCIFMKRRHSVRLQVANEIVLV